MGEGFVIPNTEIALFGASVFAGVYLAILAAWVTRYLFLSLLKGMTWLARRAIDFLKPKIEEYNNAR